MYIRAYIKTSSKVRFIMAIFTYAASFLWLTSHLISTAPKKIPFPNTTSFRYPLFLLIQIPASIASTKICDMVWIQIEKSNFKIYAESRWEIVNLFLSGHGTSRSYEWVYSYLGALYKALNYKLTSSYYNNKVDPTVSSTNSVHANRQNETECPFSPSHLICVPPLGKLWRSIKKIPHRPLRRYQTRRLRN